MICEMRLQCTQSRLYGIICRSATNSWQRERFQRDRICISLRAPIKSLPCGGFVVSQEHRMTSNCQNNNASSGNCRHSPLHPVLSFNAKQLAVTYEHFTFIARRWMRRKHLKTRCLPTSAVNDDRMVRIIFARLAIKITKIVGFVLGR